MDALWAGIMFVGGLCVGSFLNVVADRLITGGSLGGRSHCDSCHRRLVWYELIPVISYILQKGACRCDKKSMLSWQYPIVESITGLIFMLLWIYRIGIFSALCRLHSMSFDMILDTPTVCLQLSPRHLEALFFCALCMLFSSLVVLIITDIRNQIIPDVIQGVIGLSIVFMYVIMPYTIRHIGLLLASGFIVALPLLVVYLVTGGNGMGFADVKYALLMGMLLGGVGGFFALHLAFTVGAVVGFGLVLFRSAEMKTALPFGPFLVLATILLLLWGEHIVLWLLGIYAY